jgi:hypothetical protein
VPNLINSCPSCTGALEIRELYCPRCDLLLRGRFGLGAVEPLARLDAEQLAFLRLFVTSRGNLSDIERTLGVSYPTVRAKLDDLIEAISAPAPAPEPPPQPRPVVAGGGRLRRSEILARIARGELSVADGVVLLQQAARNEE